MNFEKVPEVNSCPVVFTYKPYSLEVIVAMLVHRTREEKVFWEFAFIVVQNMSYYKLNFAIVLCINMTILSCD